MAERTPITTRPNIPYNIPPPDEGVGLLPWGRAVDRLRASYVYWVATTCADGRPQSIPVWGVWLDDALYFSNGPTTQTGRNLARDPRVSVNLESGEDVVILHGVAEAVTDEGEVARVSAVYAEKYTWKQPLPPDWYVVRPRRALGWLCPSAGGTESIYAGSATRWVFE